MSSSILSKDEYILQLEKQLELLKSNQNHQEKKSSSVTSIERTNFIHTLIGSISPVSCSRKKKCRC